MIISFPMKLLRKSILPIVFSILLFSCKKNISNPGIGLTPVLSTSPVISTSATTASGGGAITSDGGSTITSRGVCWSTGPLPTIADNKTTDGTGTGTFISHLSGLTTNTTYNVRAYATNSAGTGYGNTVSFTIQTVTDIDGNIYTTITIGTQVWMVENLRTRRYRNGADISHDTANADWVSQTSGAFCNYGNGTSFAYGRLYNWYAVNSGSKLAPAGWHIPTSAEWETLKNYLITNRYNYDSTASGNKIAKSLAAQTGWLFSPTTGSVGNTDYPTFRNKSGFTALPAGIRRSLNGTFTGFGDVTRWWSATEADPTFADYYSLDYLFSDMKNGNIQKTNGFAVRCIKD